MGSRNLFVLSSFDESPEFADADPLDLATWLALHFYCTRCENGGVLVGARSWSDRQWNSVTRGRGGTEAIGRVVAAGLAGYDGTNLIVFGYDVAGEAAYLSLSGRGPKFDAPPGNSGARKRTELKVTMERERRCLEMAINARRVMHTVSAPEGREGEEGMEGTDRRVVRELVLGEDELEPLTDTAVDLGGNHG